MIPTLKKMRHEYFLDIMFLMETKNSISHVLNLQKQLGYNKVHVVDPEGLNGGLALIWKASFDITILHSDKSVIDVSVKLRSLNFYISFVYGDPTCHLRQHVWNLFTQIGSERDDLWFVVDDLNELLDNSEKLGGPPREENSFFSFWNMIQDCMLREVLSSRNKFSWAGEKSDSWVQCRLDQALGNAKWFHLFPWVHSEYLERKGSYHRFLFTWFTNENQSHFGRFIFDRRWLSNPHMVEVVKVI